MYNSRIFRASPLANTLLEKCGNLYILGDSAYPCLRNFLTPYKDRGQLTRNQQHYNVQLAKTRYVVEHCFGLLKQRFQQLYYIKLKKILFILYVLACVLHNLAIDDFNLIENEDILQNVNRRDIHDANNDDDDNEDDGNGIQVRNDIANRL